MSIPHNSDFHHGLLGEVAALFETHGGWKLQGCFLEADGEQDKIIDVWEIPNAAAVQKALAAHGASDRR